MENQRRDSRPAEYDKIGPPLEFDFRRLPEMAQKKNARRRRQPGHQSQRKPHERAVAQDFPGRAATPFRDPSPRRQHRNRRE